MTRFRSIFHYSEAPQAKPSAPALPARPPLPPAPVSGPPLPPRRSWPLGPGASPENAELRRLLFGFDATASRAGSWSRATKLTDTLLTALPDRLAVALAVHGGGRLHTLTRYTTSPAKLRDKAAGVCCEAGGTRLLDILAHSAALQADLVLYIGDSFEESGSKAGELADQLQRCGTRVIILQEGNDEYARSIFAEIADRTGGAVLPFDVSSFDRVGKELLELIAVLAVEGVEAVEARQEASTAAKMLLENLDPKRLLIGHAKR
jgi:hypothetical protein